MADFDREPYGSTDENGERGFVDITATTATQDATRQWVLTDGAQDVLGVHSGYRKARPEGLELRHLTVQLPPCDRLPERVRCRLADRAMSIASALEPNDRSSVGWVEAGLYVSRQVRLSRDQTAF